jgi:hypothetical protein
MVQDGYVQLTPGGGKELDTSELSVSAETVERERASASDPSATSKTNVQDFLDGLELGLAIQNVYTHELVGQLEHLLAEVKALKLSMEEAAL